ncbi:amidohydrolase family protein [Novosphingobium profundi]|uniref:amidohydrolase family protein n=1 Tax=Novosphingobium profundi TaxID=1774954 RepID=UPI001BDB0783|nr:amidohydrolase family protein [Novosphingobium profundi]MBT0669829.1 amidohydrolase family protein [Novosphingobium profundi]
MRAGSFRSSVLAAVLAGAALLASAAALAQAGPESSPVAPASPPGVAGEVDHHMHVHSPAILEFLPGYCSSEGRIGSCPVEFTKAYSPEDLIAQMDKSGIARGLIMSSAYLAESPMMQPPRPDAPRILRAANAWSVDLARRFPGRFGIYIGVNPVTATALPEIAHWGSNPDVTGIKLHLTNSGVDLRDPEQVAKLADVFRLAERTHLAIMIHMRTRATDYGARDVRVFLRDVLPAAGDTPVQIAHAAGWGGIDVQTLSALGAFADAIEADPSIARHLTFDLAMVWKADTPEADRAALVALIRRIGPEHFVPGSDFPFSGDLADYYGTVYPLLPLTKAEWHTILTNHPAYDHADFPRARLEP